MEFASDMRVDLVRALATDDMVVQAAQVSALGENNPETVPERLIRALMNGRHGSPFEHNLFTFFVEVPLFIAREWMRHRVGSFNEMSGRYTEMRPKFFITPTDRPLVNSGTKMKPAFSESSDDLWDAHVVRQGEVAMHAWGAYQADLEAGIANEVAREVLPLSLYTQFYWSLNARSLMNFLSLRVESDDSAVRSYPQREIHEAAEMVEVQFAERMPLTHAAFVANGRVAP